MDGIEYTDLTKISGGWTILDSTVSLSLTEKLILGQLDGRKVE